MENWSFSCGLGCWRRVRFGCGSVVLFVFWGMVAMYRGPSLTEAARRGGQLLTVFLGGFVIFGVTWVAASFVIRIWDAGLPNGPLGQPSDAAELFVAVVSFGAGAVTSGFRTYEKNRRAMWRLLPRCFWCHRSLWSNGPGTGMIALSAPLIMRFGQTRVSLSSRVRGVAA